jgi:hypothetical protein
MRWAVGGSWIGGRVMPLVLALLSLLGAGADAPSGAVAVTVTAVLPDATSRLPGVSLAMPPTQPGLAAATPTNITEPTRPVALPTLAPGSSDVDVARHAVLAFFTLLHARRYQEAAPYYGGSYDALRGWNPSVPPADHATLWKNACEVNGLQCLRIRRVVGAEETAPGEVTVIIELENEDGTLYARGPGFAGNPNYPVTSRWPIVVKKVDGRFRPRDGPPYSPCGGRCSPVSPP